MSYRSRQGASSGKGGTEDRVGCLQTPISHLPELIAIFGCLSSIHPGPPNDRSSEIRGPVRKALLPDPREVTVLRVWHMSR